MSNSTGKHADISKTNDLIGLDKIEEDHETYHEVDKYMMNPHDMTKRYLGALTRSIMPPPPKPLPIFSVTPNESLLQPSEN